MVVASLVGGNMKPYKDTFKNSNTRIRRFKQGVSSDELVWHRDRSDRVVKIVEGSGWQLQMDNGLPEKLVAGKEYHIPANNYHRLIKGKTDLVAEIKEDKMKITRRQLRRIISEAIDVINASTGETLVFADEGDPAAGNYKPDAPEAAARDIIKRLGLNPLEGYGDAADEIYLGAEDYAEMDYEIGGKRHKRKAKKERTRLDIDNLMTRLEDWALDAREDYMADNPGADMQGVAMDLAQGAKYSFAKDEWENLSYGGQFDSEDDLYTYIADLIA